jgi:hypothetical protein
MDRVVLRVGVRRKESGTEGVGDQNGQSVIEGVSGTYGEFST